MRKRTTSIEIDRAMRLAEPDGEVGCGDRAFDTPKPEASTKIIIFTVAAFCACPL